MNRKLTQKPVIKAFLLFTLAISFFLCSASTSWSTVVVYQGLDQTIQESGGAYAWSIGPLNVGNYAQVRINVWAHSTSKFYALVSATDKTGAINLGWIDMILIDGSTTNTAQASKVYEVPGKYITVTVVAANAGQIGSVVVFGK